MKVFIRVVEHGAFTRAADSLGISRASATTAVADLERHIGVRLLHRTTRRLSVTDEGQAYYAHSVRILDEIAEAEDALTGARLAPKGRLRVSVPQSFVSMVFFPALKRFMADHPQLDIDVVLTDRAVNLVEEGIDCAIRGVEIPPDSGLVMRELSVTHWLTCAAPEYLERHGTPRRIEELVGHNCIRFISPSTGRPRDWLFRVDGEPHHIVPGGNIRVDSFDAATRLARAAAGIAQVPDALGFEAVLDGSLRPILADVVSPAPPLVMVYPGNRYATHRVRAFLDFFQAVFPRDGWWAEIAARGE